MPALLIVSAIVLWSSLGLVVRFAGVQPHVLIFYSLSVAVVIQSPMFLLRRFRQAVPPAGRIHLVVLMTIFNLFNNLTFFYAYARTTIANAVLTHYIAPVIVAVMAYFFLRERITVRVVLSIILASAGLWIMLGGATFVECLRNIAREGFHVTPDLAGIASGLLSGVCYAAVVIIIRVSTQRDDPYVLVFFQNLFIALLLLPFVREVPSERWWLLVLTGIVHSTIAPFLYYKGLQKVSASSAAILGYIEPVGAVLFGIMFLSEWPGTKALIGGALIVLSGYLTIAGKDKEAARDIA